MRLLEVMPALAVGIEHARRAAAIVVLDRERHGVGAKLEPARRLGARDLAIKRRPLGARLAPLHAEADFIAGVAAIARCLVDGQATGMNIAVAEPAGAREHDLGHVGRAHRRQPVGSHDPEFLLGPHVVGLEFLKADRPIEQARTVDRAVGAERLELVGLKTRACWRPQ